MSSLPADTLPGNDTREPVLDIVDRVSEFCFGLFMALSFVGAVSIATAGQDAGRELMHAALGCNLAWGMVDAVMYLLRTLIDRSKRLSIGLAVQSAQDSRTANERLLEALPHFLRPLLGSKELDAIRQRVASIDLRNRPKLRRDDFLGAIWIFFIVVLSTFPVVLPFLLLNNMSTALVISRILTLVMLFAAGIALGRHAGYGKWKAGFGMVGVGVCLTAAIVALGG